MMSLSAIRYRLIVLSALVTFIGFWVSACGNTNDGASADALVAPNGISTQPMPPQTDTAEVSFRDLNYWTENNLFCIATLVDNNGIDWRRIWVRIELLDSTGQVIEINNEPFMTVRALADAIPPRGSSAFFVAIPFSQLSGVPTSCRLSGAGSVRQEAGAILISGLNSGYRVQKPDPKDPTKVQEIAFQASTTIENPLPLTAQRLRIVLLIYGKDNKLWFVQRMNPEDPQEKIKLEGAGPMGPGEIRKLSCPISYEMLPKKLQEVLISRVDVQAFEVRE